MATVLTEPATTQLLDKIFFKKSGTYNRLLTKSPFSSQSEDNKRWIVQQKLEWIILASKWIV